MIKSLIRIGLFLLLFLLLLLGSPVWATDYYVDGSCESSGDGTTAVCGTHGPWKTFAEGNSGVAAGTHTINVAAGTYAERITNSRAGAGENQYRWWKANGTVYMRGFVVNANYIKITGFDIQNVASGEVDLDLNTGSGYCYISGNVIHDGVYRGLRLFQSDHNTVIGNTIARATEIAFIVNQSDYNLIEDNDISDTQTSGSQNDAFRVYDTSPGGNIFRGNYIHDFHFNTGAEHTDAFQGYFIDSIIEKNHVVMLEHSPGAEAGQHGFMLENGTSNLIIRNNILEVHSLMNTGDAWNTNIYFYNNTCRSSLDFWADPYEAYGLNLRYIHGVVEIKNNIFIDFETHIRKQSDCDATVTSEYNLFWNSDSSALAFDLNGTAHTFTEWKVHYDNVLPSKNADPIFVTQWTDLQLQSSSPCKDTGLTIATVTDDYAGVSRPQGATYDIGAYEYEQNIESLLSTGVFFYRSPIFCKAKKPWSQPASRPLPSPIRRPEIPNIISVWA